MARRPPKKGPGRGGPRRDRRDRRDRGGAAPPPLRDGIDQLEGRNVVYEALKRQRRPVLRIWLDARTRPHTKIDAILALAEAQGVPVAKVPRADLDARSFTGVHNGIVAEAETLPENTVQGLLSDLARAGEDPFFVLVDEVQYEHNLGAILRSCLGAGVNGLIIPVRRGKGVTPVVQRVAMGAAEAVPVAVRGEETVLVCGHDAREEELELFEGDVSESALRELRDTCFVGLHAPTWGPGEALWRRLLDA